MGALLRLAAWLPLLLALPAGAVIIDGPDGTANTTPPPDVTFNVRATGTNARLNDQVKALLSGGNGVEIDAHSIQPYYARRVATAAGLTVTAEQEGEEVVLKSA